MGGTTLLDTLRGNGFGTAVNASGLVTGEAFTATGSHHAFLRDGTTMLYQCPH